MIYIYSKSKLQTSRRSAPPCLPKFCKAKLKRACNSSGIKQKGIAVVFITILVSAVMFTIAISINILTFVNQKISFNTVRSNQIYYASEGGIEDALLYLKNNPLGNLSYNYNMNVGLVPINVDIPIEIGGSRTITSRGNFLDRIRELTVVYSISSHNVSFFYGVQIGDGGMEMGNNSRVKGNVFSNGSVIVPTGTAYIDNTIIVAGNGNKIKNLTVGEDAQVHTCEDSTIGGSLVIHGGGSATNCGTFSTQADEISPQNSPVSSSQISDWKNEAAAGGVEPDNVSISEGGSICGSCTNILGPKQIGTPEQPRDLTVDINACLRITGNIYVTGSIDLGINSKICLDSDYGSHSGVVIADGTINVSNDAVLNGSDQTGSYILILSTNSSLDPGNPAISVNNNAQGAIFYTSSGLIYLANNVRLREVTGYKIKLDNEAEVEYGIGLQNLTFINGPGGGWRVERWYETSF